MMGKEKYHQPFPFKRKIEWEKIKVKEERRDTEIRIIYKSLN